MGEDLSSQEGFDNEIEAQIHAEFSVAETKCQAFARFRKDRPDIQRILGVHTPSFEFDNARAMVASAATLPEGRTSLAPQIKKLLSMSDMPEREFSGLADRMVRHLLKGTDLRELDLADVIIGIDLLNQETAKITYAAGLLDDPTQLEKVEGNRQAFLHAATIRLVDSVSFDKMSGFDTGQLRKLHQAVVGPERRPLEAIVLRMANSLRETAVMAQLAAATSQVEMDKGERQQMDAYNRQLIGEIAKKQAGNYRVAPLIVQGADLGIPGYDIIMGHPDFYGVPLEAHRQVVGDFFLVEPKLEHRLPTIVQEYKRYSIDFGDEKLFVPLRLFKNGSVDFGMLHATPTRSIETIFRRMDAQAGLRLLMTMLPALICDATAPTEVLESDEVASLPRTRIVREAFQGRARPKDIMTTVLIPRIQMMRRLPAVNPEEHIQHSDKKGSARRWHLAEHYARKLPAGYRRSDENLQKYLDDIRRGYINPLQEDDHAAVLAGTKCYMPPSERGDERLGRVVSRRAVLGRGATQRVVRRDWPEKE
ncbi:MAG TPA: hypothetical protein VLF60_01335 [Candidatus Saccharimonadales bacterium]|nr:hypothetical protein [Candidatus Saccharimonadales bacterium]